MRQLSHILGKIRYWLHSGLAFYHCILRMEHLLYYGYGVIVAMTALLYVPFKHWSTQLAFCSQLWEKILKVYPWTQQASLVVLSSLQMKKSLQPPALLNLNAAKPISQNTESVGKWNKIYEAHQTNLMNRWPACHMLTCQWKTLIIKAQDIPSPAIRNEIIGVHGKPMFH